MADRPVPPGSIVVGGGVTGSALATGHQNVQQVSHGAASDEQAAVLAALRDIRLCLAELAGPYGTVARANMDAAIVSAEVAAPEKPAIGMAVQGALDAANKTADFAAKVITLAPALKVIGGWLGIAWSLLG